jgi:hypothetical protein
MTDIHACSQEQSDAVVEHVMSDDCYKDITYKLGAIVWILAHGRKVKSDALVTAKGWAEELLKSVGSSGYVSIPDRIACLNQEIHEIQKAFCSDGAAGERHIPGLLDKIDKAMRGETAAGECVAGCSHFSNGDTRHDKNCPRYPGSMSEQLDVLEAEHAQAGKR